MIGRTNAGGGGGVPKIKVVGGTTQPAGRENRIWAVTSVDIPSWIVSQEEPANPASGMVWIKDGKNKSCKQYIDGKWKLLESFIYRGGSWVQFSYDRYYIFKAGDGAIVPLTTILQSNNSKVTIGNNSITLQKLGGENYGCIVRTESQLNLSGYTKLVVKLTVTEFITSWGPAAVGISSNAPTVFTDRALNFVAFDQPDSVASWTDKTVVIDISSLESGYFAAGTFIYGSITDIWLE